MRWRREDSFPVSQAPERICRRLSRFCNILLQDLTPLHVKITRGTNLSSVCRKKLKLSTYLHIVSYNHISFLTRRWQIAWVLAMSSGFYSITWRTIAGSAGYKIQFRKQPPYRGNVFPCRCNIFRFLEFILLGSSPTAPVFSCNQINKQPENLYVNYRGCSQRPRFYNVTLLHEKFLQFNWLRAVVFQLNLKYLHVKISNALRLVVKTNNSMICTWYLA